MVKPKHNSSNKQVERVTLFHKKWSSLSSIWISISVWVLYKLRTDWVVSISDQCDLCYIPLSTSLSYFEIQICKIEIILCFYIYLLCHSNYSLSSLSISVSLFWNDSMFPRINMIHYRSAYLEVHPGSLNWTLLRQFSMLECGENVF